MDIFEYAKEFDKDYYDAKKCLVYKVQDYNKNKRLEIPVDGIEIFNLNGEHVGYIYEPE